MHQDIFMHIRGLLNLFDCIFDGGKGTGKGVKRTPKPARSGPDFSEVTTIHCLQCAAPLEIWTKALYADCTCGHRMIILPYDEDVEWIESVIESAHATPQIHPADEGWLKAIIESAHSARVTG